VESEPETQNIANYFKQNGPILGAIDFHSYSQLILRPWGYTNESCPDEEELKELGEGMSQAAYGVHHVKYTPERGIQLYTVSGAASDWYDVFALLFCEGQTSYSTCMADYFMQPTWTSGVSRSLLYELLECHFYSNG